MTATVFVMLSGYIRACKVPEGVLFQEILSRWICGVVLAMLIAGLPGRVTMRTAWRNSEFVLGRVIIFSAEESEVLVRYRKVPKLIKVKTCDRVL